MPNWSSEIVSITTSLHFRRALLARVSIRASSLGRSLYARKSLAREKVFYLWGEERRETRLSPKVTILIVASPKTLR